MTDAEADLRIIVFGIMEHFFSETSPEVDQNKDEEKPFQLKQF